MIRLSRQKNCLKTYRHNKPKNVNVDVYVDAMGSMLKASGLNKANPQWYPQFVQKARAMRMEVLEFMNKVLEYWNMTWEDLGYKVVLLQKTQVMTCCLYHKSNQRSSRDRELTEFSRYLK